MTFSTLFLSSFLVTIILLVVTPNASAQRRARPVSSSAQQSATQADRLISEGASALERGDTALAKASFERTLQIDPNNSLAHTYLGILADRANDLARAEGHFAAAAIANPLSPSARNNHGAILLRLGRNEQAAAQFETSLHLDKNQPSALINLAQIRLSSGTPDGLRAARGLFDRAHALAPEAEISRALVIIALRLNDSAAATSYFRDYLEQLASSSAAAAAAPVARAELGAALLEAGLLEEATQELGAAADADRTNVDAVLLLARAYRARKDIPSAGRTLEGAIARGLDAAPVYAALAEVYQQSGHMENAIPAMRLAIERDPKNEAYRFRYGMLLTDTKAPGAALIRLKEALIEFPRSVQLWFALGLAHTALDQYGEAAKAFSSALEFDPRFPPALSYLGIIQAQMGQYGEAVALYERALASDEKLAVTHYLTADALTKLTPTDTARVETHLARAIELDPTFIPARLALGKLYLRADRLPEAVSQLERLVAADPELAEAHYQLGQVYKRLKRTGEAQMAFAKFKQLSEKERGKSWDEQREIARRLANVRF